VLIGVNLSGLQGYIREAWSEKAPQLSLWKDAARPDPGEAIQVLEQQAVQMRLPVKSELILAHLRIMLAAQPQVTNLDEYLTYWNQPETLKARLALLNLGEIETSILDHLQWELRIHSEYHDFAEEVRQARPEQAGGLDERFRELLQQWFQNKIIVIEDYYASGNQIIELIAQQTPPGFLNRIMCIQNIKGTGLDFVYRWQAWQAYCNAVQSLRAAEKNLLTPQAIAPLAAFQDYGVLCTEHVQETIARVKNSGLPHPAHLLQELDTVQERLDSAMESIRQKMKSSGGKQSSWFTTLLMRLEEFLDAGDAVRRRGQTDRIYEDLLTQRISRERAVAELQALTQRQKGGWPMKKLSSHPVFGGNFWLKPKAAIQHWFGRLIPLSRTVTNHESDADSARRGVRRAGLRWSLPESCHSDFAEKVPMCGSATLNSTCSSSVPK